MSDLVPRWQNTKNSIPFVSTLLQYFCHGPEITTSTTPTLPEPHSLEKGNGNHIQKTQRPFPLFQEFLLRYVGLAGLILNFTVLPSSAPPAADSFCMCCLAFLCTTPEVTGGTRSLPQLPRNWICCWEFNYREQSRQQTEKWPNVKWGKCRAEVWHSSASHPTCYTSSASTSKRLCNICNICIIINHIESMVNQ